MFPDATQAGTSCTFDGFRDDGDRGDSTFCLVESEGDGNDGGDWLGEETAVLPSPSLQIADHWASFSRILV